MALPTLHHTFRLVADPEVRILPSGTTLAKMRLAANSSKKNDRGEWVDADRFFVRATSFGRAAEAVAEAELHQGDEVTVRGRMKTEQWETAEGDKRSGDELLVDEIARPIRPPRQDTQAPASGQARTASDEPPF